MISVDGRLPRSTDPQLRVALEAIFRDLAREIDSASSPAPSPSMNKVTDAKTGITTAGVHNPATVTKAPEGGFTVTFTLSAGTCKVHLRAWNISTSPEVLHTVDLPVPSGSKIGQMYDTVTVNNVYDDFDYNVEDISGGTLTAYMTGLGV